MLSLFQKRRRFLVDEPKNFAPISDFGIFYRWRHFFVASREIFFSTNVHPRVLGIGSRVRFSDRSGSRKVAKNTQNA
jgi:hypothetical protein